PRHRRGPGRVRPGGVRRAGARPLGADLRGPARGPVERDEARDVRESSGINCDKPLLQSGTASPRVWTRHMTNVLDPAGSHQNRPQFGFGTSLATPGVVTCKKEFR